jgi:hypothetical protein
VTVYYPLLRNPRIPDGIHKIPTLELILTMLNLVLAYTLHIFKIHFNIIIHDDTYISYPRYTTSIIANKKAAGIVCTLAAIVSTSAERHQCWVHQKYLLLVFPRQMI